MRKLQRFSSFSYDDEPIYDSISDFDQTHFQTHSTNDIQRATIETNSFRSRQKINNNNTASSVDSSEENRWQQYWDWYIYSIYCIIKLRCCIYSSFHLICATHKHTARYFYCIFSECILTRDNNIFINPTFVCLLFQIIFFCIYF